jgi:hypothetical protein
MANNPDINPGGDGERIDATPASAGQKTGRIRWVLIIGTVLAICGLAAIWLITFHRG